MPLAGKDLVFNSALSCTQDSGAWGGWGWRGVLQLSGLPPGGWRGGFVEARGAGGCRGGQGGAAGLPLHLGPDLVLQLFQPRVALPGQPRGSLHLGGPLLPGPLGRYARLVAPRGARQAARRYQAVLILGLACRPHWVAAGLPRGVWPLRVVGPGLIGTSLQGTWLCRGLGPPQGGHEVILDCRRVYCVCPGGPDGRRTG